MILKSVLKMAQVSARCIPHLLLEVDCEHNQASDNCKIPTPLVIQLTCAGGSDI